MVERRGRAQNGVSGISERSFANRLQIALRLMHFGTAAAAALLAAAASALAGDEAELARIGARLTAGYPGIVLGLEGGDVVFADGMRLPLMDGKGEKSFADWLEKPSIADMFKIAYAKGIAAQVPPQNSDPGRARNEAFFDKVYGDCAKGEVEKTLTTVVWLPTKSGQHLKATTINGVAARLSAISRELDRLPARFNVYLSPSEGVYNCRAIAGTNNRSAHSYGIAIDIATTRAHYWRNALAKPHVGTAGHIAYRNRIPFEIVDIFEKYGFIWGGKWYHYDTMHFEYRPELLPPEAAAGIPKTIR